MNTRHILKLLVGVFALIGLGSTVFADDTGATLSQKNNLYTNAGAMFGYMSMNTNGGTGASSSTSIDLVGADGSFGFDNVFPAGQYLNVTGNFLAGGNSTIAFGGVGAGVGAHAEFEPVVGNTDIGKISVFGSLLEDYTSVTVSEPTYTFNGQTYGGNITNSSSNTSFSYGVKWLIFNVYEWDFYGVNGGGSSSSSSQGGSPVGGNSINLKFKWLMEPKPKSPYLGVYYQHQNQSGSSSDSFLIIGGYVW